MFSKNKAERLHFKKRMSERYGLDISRENIVRIVKIIQRNQSIFTIKQSNTRSIHFISYADRVIPMVYDKLRKELVTALPATKFGNIIEMLEWRKK